jgi:hypothetical protein
MPNHIHALLYLSHAGTSLSKIVGEGKRFMAYSIVGGLKRKGKESLLKKLEDGVDRKERLKVRGIRYSSFHLMQGRVQ